MKLKARPSPKQLRKLYRGLLTTSQVYRIEVLKTVMQWYDDALAYIDARDKNHYPSLDQLRAREEMLARRMTGIRCESQQDKENSFASAITCAEKVCARFKPYSVKRAYDECKAFMLKVANQQAKLELKHQPMLHLLEAALAPKASNGKPLELHVIEGDRERAFSRSGDEYIFNRQTARACQKLLRSKGPLPFLIDEIQPLSRASATVDDGDGHFKVDAERQVKAIFEMLGNLATFCQRPDAPKRLARSNVPDSVRKPRLGQRSAFARGFTGPRVAGMYIPGTAVAVLYETLLPGEWRERSELQSLFPANLGGRVQRLKRDGWVIETEGSKIRMTTKGA